jgi:hypothetical protein
MLPRYCGVMAIQPISLRQKDYLYAYKELVRYNLVENDYNSCQYLLKHQYNQGKSSMQMEKMANFRSAYLILVAPIGSDTTIALGKNILPKQIIMAV